MLTLNELSPNEKAVVSKLSCHGALLHRLLAFGLTPGTHIKLCRVAPLGCPIEILVRGTRVCLRRAEAQMIVVNQVMAQQALTSNEVYQ